jgi:5,10-methenyltetrahydromethanopterin hydrogenase
MAYRPPAPFSPTLTGNPRDQMRQLADAISRKADATLEPVYSSVQLIAPGGAVYRVSVDDDGALSAVVVAR